MRQAGRYLPEYRELRGDRDILDAIREPEVAVELTLQPLRRMPLDAAIVFADIMVPVAAIGVPVRIEPGVGPVVDDPVRDAAGVARLRALEPDLDEPYVAETIRLLRKELRVPLIGFAGAPFTLASYLVEGGPSRDHVRTKALLHDEPGTWSSLMDALAALSRAHLLAQIEAGAQAVQLFDSWAGSLAPSDYERSVRPWSARVLEDLPVPSIHFGVGTGELLTSMRDAGGDAIGVDWRVPLDRAWERIGARPRDPGQPRSLGLRRLVGRGRTRRHRDPRPRGEPRRPRVQPRSRRAAGHARREPATPRRPRARTDGSMSAPPIGVLVMAYGTASGPDDIERYYTDIRGGRPPTPEHLEELRERYAAIGNRFPLLDITRQQAEGLERELNRGEAGAFRAYLGMKHSPPFIAEAVERMREDGIQRAIGIVMAPHWSGMSVESYVERVREQAGEGPPAFDFVRSYHDDPGFVSFLADRVADALSGLSAEERRGATVVFSAHSLPTRTVEDGSLRCLRCHACEDACRYRDGLAETADRVAAELGLPRHEIAWQSAGRTDDPWWGPPIEEVLADLASQGCPAAVVCSAGFVADHLEILYDLDIEAKAIAERAGMRLVRTEMPNADPAFVRVLADVVRERLAAPTP